MFGYNVQDWSQNNGMGEELIPGATNRPLYAQPTYSNHGLQQAGFLARRRTASRGVVLPDAVDRAQAGYTGMYVGNIRRAATSVNYACRTWAIARVGTQDLIVNGVDVGVEFVY